MKNQIALTVIYLIAISLLLIFNELIYRRLGLKGEFTRKFAHLTATLSTITFPYLFDSHWYVFIMASAFSLVLLVTQLRKKLSSIHNIDRKSAGSYLLPVAIYVTFLISEIFEEKFLYILPMLILAVSDPLAGIIGLNLRNGNHKIRIGRYKSNKTVLGSVSFLISSLIITLIALYFHKMVFDLKTFWLAIGISLLTTGVELFSWHGTDNLSIPLSVLFILILFL